MNYNDAYLQIEIGRRCEITTSMIDRAEKAAMSSMRQYWSGLQAYLPETRNLLLLQRSTAPPSVLFGAASASYGGAFGSLGSIGSVVSGYPYQSTYPFCGKG